MDSVLQKDITGICSGQILLESLTSIQAWTLTKRLIISLVPTKLQGRIVWVQMFKFFKTSSVQKNLTSFLKLIFCLHSLKSLKIILAKQKRKTLQIYGLSSQIVFQEGEEFTLLMTFLSLKLMMSTLCQGTLIILTW